MFKNLYLLIDLSYFASILFYGCSHANKNNMISAWLERDRNWNIDAELGRAGVLNPTVKMMNDLLESFADFREGTSTFCWVFLQRLPTISTLLILWRMRN